jgi:uncharacterized membrane protein
MLEIIEMYVASVLVMMGLDGLWLGFIVKNFNLKHLGFLLAPAVTWWPIILFYPIYAIGVVVFVLIPSIEAKSLTMAITRGALLGLVSYAAYDLTNNATLPNWPALITLTDISWGIVCTALTASIVYLIFK